jgi:hypothetical protein
VASSIEKFRDEYLGHIRHGACTAAAVVAA